MSELPFALEKLPVGKSIVGRDEEIDSVVATLSPGGKSLAILAEARSGKETVVREALSRRSSMPGRTVVCDIDLTNVRSFEDFTAVWCDSMRDSAQEVNRGALLPFEINIDEIAGNKLFELPGIVSSEAGVMLVVYFKEFQNLLHLEGETFRLEQLDRIWSRQKGVRYIITGSFINAMKSIFLERKCFYGMCRTLEFKPLDKKTVCQYIHSTFLNYGRIIEMEEAMAICEVASCNMWYIKQICALCCSLAGYYMNRKVVNEARDSIISIHEPRFKQTIFDLTGQQVNLLHAVVDGTTRFSTAETMERYHLNSSAGVARSKEALMKKEVLTFDQDDNARIIDPLFDYWLRHYYFI